MKSKIVKVLLLGSSLRMFLLGSNIVISFFMMPFLISSLGVRFYGFWAIVGKLMGYYGFLDFGLSSSVSRFLSQSFAREDVDRMNRVLNTGFILFLIIGIFALIVTAVLVFTVPLFMETKGEVRTFQLVILLMGGSLSLEFPVRAFRGLLEAKIRFDLMTYIDLFRLLTRTALIFYFVYIGHGILTMAIIVFCVNAVSHLITIVFARREFTQLKLKASLFDRTSTREFSLYSLSTFIIQLANTFKFRANAFIIAGFIGLGSVTLYEVATRLMAYFIQLIDRTMGVLTPVFSQHEGKGEFSQIRQLFLEATLLGSMLAVYVGSSIAVYSDVFITRWMGEGFEESIRVIGILIIPITIALSQNPSLSLLKGISKHHFYAVSNTVEGVLNLVLSIILVQYYGIYGVAYGLALPMLLMKIIIQPIYVCRVAGVGTVQYYFRYLLLPGLETFGFVYGFYWVFMSYFKPVYLNIFVLFVCQSFLFLPVCFFLIMSKAQRGYVLQRMLRRKGS